MLGGRAVSPLVGVRSDAIQGWNCSDQEPMGAKRRPLLLLIQQGGKGNRRRRLRHQVSLVNPGECLLGTVFFGVFDSHTQCPTLFNWNAITHAKCHYNMRLANVGKCFESALLF